MKVYSIDLRNVSKEIYKGHLQLGGTNLNGVRIDLTNYYLELDNKPWIPIMGEFHYSRFPYHYWEDEILKIKAGGITVASTYIFWNHHEEEEGVFNWTNNRNLRSYVELCGKHGLYLIVRMGPFCHGEARNGGMPDWLYARQFPLRSNDERYLYYVNRLFAEIAGQLSGLLFKDGGPVIGIQLENEFMHSGAPWEVTYKKGMEWVTAGSGGEDHMYMLKKLAKDVGIEVPLYTCTAWGSPVLEHEFLPMFGGYAFYGWEEHLEQKPSPNYIFSDFHKKDSLSYDRSDVPFACCEMGGGMQVYYQNRPVVPADSVEAMTIVKIASGSNLVGYYMYHGGSNPVGRNGFMNEHRCPRISYDYQAPVGEFGQLSESYKRLKRQFLFLNDFCETLAGMFTVLPESAEGVTPDDCETMRWAVRVKDESGFLFLNNYQDHVNMKTHDDVHITLKLEGESIILPQGKGLTLQKDVSAILPFNLSLDGIVLKYATAQLMTSLKDNGTVYYFFFGVLGIRSEFAFVNSGFGSVEASKGAVTIKDGVTYVSVEPGMDSVISLTRSTGANVVVCTLTHEESLHIWKANVWEQERIIVTNAGLMFDKDAIQMTITGENVRDIYIFPDKKEGLGAWGGTLTEIGYEGIFRKYRIEFPTFDAGLTVERLAEENAMISIERFETDAINDLFLVIGYEGDIGEAYIDGKLVHDHFWNGVPWTIGLKRFAPNILSSGLFVHIISSGNATANIQYTDMAAMIVSDQGDGMALIKSVCIIPEYKGSLY